jgi:hypothetical protein
VKHSKGGRWRRRTGVAGDNDDTAWAGDDDDTAWAGDDDDTAYAGGNNDKAWVGGNDDNVWAGGDNTQKRQVAMTDGERLTATGSRGRDVWRASGCMDPTRLFYYYSTLQTVRYGKI